MNHVTIAPRFHVALDRGYVDELKGRLVRTLFTFGAYGNHHVLVLGYHVDDALEIAADVLIDVAPGLFLPFSEAEENEAGEVVDHTYTERGYIHSWEWAVVDDASRADIKSRVEEVKR